MDTEETRPERISPHTVLVMSVLLENADRDMYGLELCDLTGIQHGTLYLILKRQAERGRLTGCWEDGSARASGRPLRMYYRITPDGVDFTKDILSRPSAADARALLDEARQNVAEKRRRSAVDKLARQLARHDPDILRDALEIVNASRDALPPNA